MNVVIRYRHQSFANYHQVSDIRRTLIDNLIVDHLDVVVGAAPTTSSFST